METRATTRRRWWQVSSPLMHFILAGVFVMLAVVPWIDPNDQSNLVYRTSLSVVGALVAALNLGVAIATLVGRRNGSISVEPRVIASAQENDPNRR